MINIEDVLDALEQSFIDELGGPGGRDKQDGNSAYKRNQRNTELGKNKHIKELMAKFKVCD